MPEFTDAAKFAKTSDGHTIVIDESCYCTPPGEDCGQHITRKSYRWAYINKTWIQMPRRSTLGCKDIIKNQTLATIKLWFLPESKDLHKLLFKLKVLKEFTHEY